jgi:hypothetical protein
MKICSDAPARETERMTTQYLEYVVWTDYVASIICPTFSIVGFEEVQNNR